MEEVERGLVEERGRLGGLQREKQRSASELTLKFTDFVNDVNLRLDNFFKVHFFFCTVLTILCDLSQFVQLSSYPKET